MPTKTRQPNEAEWALLGKLMRRGAYVYMGEMCHRVEPGSGGATHVVPDRTVTGCVAEGWLSGWTWHKDGEYSMRIEAKGRCAYERKRPRKKPEAKKPEAKKPARRYVLRYKDALAIQGRKAGYEFTMPMTLKQAQRDSKKPHAPSVICEVLPVKRK